MRLCTVCREPHTPDSAEAAHFLRHDVPVPEQLYDAPGCKACAGTGHTGRIGIFEMIEVGATLREAIDRGAGEAEMATLALGASETLFGQGLLAAASGRTSLAETLRVVGDVA